MARERARPAVVIGAGHNGLVCAIALARAGIDVVVLERAPEPGGAVSSGQCTLPGYVHDLHAAFFPQAVLSPVLRRLPLEQHGLEWVNPPVPMAHPFADGSAIALHRDVETTARGLDAAAAGAGGAWRQMLARLLPHREAIVETALARFPPLLPAARLALGLRGEAVEVSRQMLSSAAALGEELFGASRPTAWLCGSVGHSDLSPGQSGSAAIGFGLALLGHIAGWPFPRGGAGALTQALVSMLREAGGQLRCGAHVESIELERGRVAGVLLRGGERLPAGAVVATVGPSPLLAMLPGGALGTRLTRRLSRWRYGLGTFKLDLALAGPVPWSASACRQAGVVHVGGELRELFEAPQSSALGNTPQRPVLVVGQHSLHDDRRAPEGCHTLYAYTRLPSRPTLSDAEIAELLEQRIEQFAPGFRALIRARAVRGPARQETENPALVGGDLAAGSVTLDQLLIFRPAPELVRYRTPVDGLYVAGAGTHPGPGVHGISGDGAARALIGDRRPAMRAFHAARAARRRPQRRRAGAAGAERA